MKHPPRRPIAGFRVSVPVTFGEPGERVVGEVDQLLSTQFTISEDTGKVHFCFYTQDWREEA